MKTVAIIFVLVLCAAGLHAVDSEKMAHVIALAARLESVEGCAVGDQAQAGYFSLLAKFVIRGCQEGDIAMLYSSNKPIVRLLGYQCALALPVKIDPRVEAAVLSDTTKVVYRPFGCIGGAVTIGDVAREIRNDPRLLLDGPKSWANQP